MNVCQLKPGDHHYMAYVGPPGQYDFMGATQFRLLATLGLRARHRVLDFGCGSLRAGRLLIAYLDPGNYCGVDPNQWLVRDAVREQLGEDMVRIKRPCFRHNDDFRVDKADGPFDFILAQSIFSHAGADLVSAALDSFRTALTDGGIIACTFVEARDDFQGTGWVYPACVAYRAATVRRLAADAGLFAARIPWFHPRQAWYLMARRKGRLPGRRMYRHLRGAVLSDPELAASWNRRDSAAGWSKSLLRKALSGWQPRRLLPKLGRPFSP